MSSPGLPRLDIEVRGRRSERWIAVACCALALLMSWLMLLQVMPRAWALTGGLLAVVVVAAGFHQARWWGGPHRIERVIWAREGQWLLLDAGGQAREALLSADSRIGPGWVWLRWQSIQPRSLLLLLCDVPPETLRRLSVRLRMDRQLADVPPPTAAI